MLKKFFFIAVAAILATFHVSRLFFKEGSFTLRSVCLNMPPFAFALGILIFPADCPWAVGVSSVLSTAVLETFSTTALPLSICCIYAAAAFVPTLLLALLGMPELALIVVAMVCVAFVVHLYAMRLRRLRDLVKRGVPSLILEDSLPVILAIMTLSLSCIVMPFAIDGDSAKSLPSIACDIVSALMFSAIYFRLAIGRHMFLPSAVVDRLETMQPASDKKLRSKNAEDKLRIIFGRICDFMEKDQPYLDPGLTKGTVAKAIFTNETYVGKAVSHFSKKNFCNFVNSYRVQYAMDRFEDDPTLRVGQLALMSGFRNKSTFKLAFKLVADMSPLEWCNAYRERMKI